MQHAAECLMHIDLYGSAVEISTQLNEALLTLL
jgi:hypothetical protein